MVQNRNIFLPPLSFRALACGDPYGIFGKALQILKLVFGAVDGEDLMILTCTVFARSTRVTGGQTDRIAMAKTRYSSTVCYEYGRTDEG